MRICILKTTGQVLEMQSLAVEGTLINNAIAAGYNVKDLEEKEVNNTEYVITVGNDPVIIAAKEAAQAAEVLKYQTQQAKEADIVKYLASWDSVDKEIGSINTVEEVKTYLKKLSRVVYWLAKNSEV